MTTPPARVHIPDRRNRLSELDLLRFLAALAVVLFHYAFRGTALGGRSLMPYAPLEPVARYGFLGVELFFMISGFVILMTASNGDLKRFVISRLVRLYPVFWVCCSLTFVTMLVLGGAHFSVTFAQYLVNLTMLSGFFGVPAVDGVYWSLLVELRFYALVALVLVFGQLGRAQLLLVLWLAASLVLPLLPATLPGSLLGSLLITGRAPLFIGGALCYLLHRRGASTVRLGLVGVAWVAALNNVLQDIPGFETLYATDLNPYIVAGIVSGMFGVLVLVGLGRTGWIGRRDWVRLGALTYPLYLVHQNIGYMIFNAGYPTVSPHVLLWGTLAAMLGLSYLLDRYVERRYGGRFRGTLESWALTWEAALSGRPVPRPTPLASRRQDPTLSRRELRTRSKPSPQHRSAEGTSLRPAYQTDRSENRPEAGRSQGD